MVMNTEAGTAVVPWPGAAGTKCSIKATPGCSQKAPGKWKTVYSPRETPPQLGMRRSSMGCGEQLHMQEKLLKCSSCSPTNQHICSQARSGQNSRPMVMGKTVSFGGKI